MPLRIALAQISPTVGAICTVEGYRGNKDIILEAWRTAKEKGADLVVCPEMTLIGYPARDLVQHIDLLQVSDSALRELTQETKNGPGLLVGAPFLQDGLVYNAAFLLDGGEIKARIAKHELPSYGPFDDKRNFAPGPVPDIVEYKGVKLGVMICEDIWFPKIVRHLKEQGAEILVSLNASPYQFGKHALRIANTVGKRVEETGLTMVYVNQCVSVDGLPFDGSSFVMNGDKTIPLQMAAWREGVEVAVFERMGSAWQCLPNIIAAQPDDMELLYYALVFATRDYMRQNDFTRAVLGLSGGIDSALVAVIVTDAIGAANVTGLRMPSKYSSQHSLDDAAELARNAGIQMETIPIQPIADSYHHALAPFENKDDSPLAGENVQARIRGNLLMYLSNKSRERVLVLATGNKSEMAVGYSTLYGDMCGGFNPLKDVWKTQVYQLARWRNANKPIDALGPDGPVIPESMLTKAPSAELKPGQFDRDSLPPYDILDGILQRFIEMGQPVQDIIASGYDARLVMELWRKVNHAEYKRQQAAPGVKVSASEFTREYRMPISNRFSPDQVEQDET